MRLNFEPVSAAIGAIAILLALSLSSAQAPHQADRIARELRVAGIPAPEDMILIREGLPFVVPDGKIFVLTAVGRSYGTGGANYIKIDGAIELQFNAATPVNMSSVPPGFAVPAGSTIEVSMGEGYGRAWGYLSGS